MVRTWYKDCKDLIVDIDNGRCPEKKYRRVKKRVGSKVRCSNLCMYFSRWDIWTFGKHYFEVAMMLRNSLLVNGIIYNIDAWSNINEKEIEDFNKIDRILLCNILKVSKNLPKEALYLELRIMELNMIINSQRLIYFFDIMTRKRKRMLQNFMITQWFKETKGDWT